MEQSSSANPNRAMIIIAHPDDGEWMAAGTLSKWARAGTEVTYVLCTSGDKGTSDPNVKPADLAAFREVEQQNAVDTVDDGRLTEEGLIVRRDAKRQLLTWCRRVHKNGAVPHRITRTETIPREQAP